ncbi:ABC transporter substrate-binding protein [Alteribacillus sp. HJP-4]|uniref:ABC transporter substrate-binding protein n=1 Tax=Alteribacillus sp. HJP-4 TaxID=2775394 RepID=UPI0035CCF9B8
MRKKGRLFLSMFFIFCLCMISACGQQGEEQAEIRISEVTRSIFYAPLYAAIEEGFFEDENLSIDLTTAWGGDKTMTALLSDGADIALVGAETSVYVNAQNPADDIINFAMLTQSDGTFLISREPNEDFEWSDLEGSSFLGQRKGGMPQMTGEFVLKNHGIDPAGDLNLIQNVDYANIPGAFASGTGDYVQLFEPQASQFEKEGLGHIVASFGEESGPVPYTVFMAKDGYLQDQSDEVERFTRAIYKAQQWVYNSEAEEVAASIAPWFEDTPQEIIASSIERYKEQESYAKTPYLPEEAWNNLLDIMEEAGELPERSDYNRYVDLEVADQVTGTQE